MTALNSLSIIIPAYNERDNIRDTADSVLRGITGLITDFELILVDDGSDDGTGEIMDSFAASDSHVHIIHHALNLGKGAALRSGFSQASKEWILFLDADGQVSVSELNAFLDFIDDYDVIAGYRAPRSDSRARRFFSSGYNMLISRLLGLRMKDINCPFKLFKKSILGSIELWSSGFLIDAEIIYRAAKGSFRIKELPVKSYPRSRGSSTVKPRHMLETLRELFSLLKWKKKHL